MADFGEEIPDEEKVNIYINISMIIQIKFAPGKCLLQFAGSCQKYTKSFLKGKVGVSRYLYIL